MMSSVDLHQIPHEVHQNPDCLKTTKIL
uniref:Uncharacterized protein n=1 Tax=Rhizophora mucronata TaxID=61149 RepID=A0A2P2QVC5_RHIMU